MTAEGLIANGRYQPKGMLATGGFKLVWRAWDHERQCDVALAILHNIEDSESAKSSFLREARALAEIRHRLPPQVAPFADRVVELIDFGRLDDAPPFVGPYIATRFVEGRTLHKVKKEAPLPWRRVAKIAIGILQALEVSHCPTPSRGPIFHRDIKPANIMLGDHDEVVVLDFGVAKLADTNRSHQSQVVGTLQYMAPEQFETGSEIGPGVDLFSVGVIMHELLTGHPPWPRSSLRSALTFYMAVKEGDAPSLSHLDPLLLPADLNFAIRNALTTDPQKRSQSATQMRVMLERLLAQMAPGANRAPPVAPVMKRVTTPVRPAIEPDNPDRADPLGGSDTLDGAPTAKPALPMETDAKDRRPWGVRLAMGTVLSLGVAVGTAAILRTMAPAASTDDPPPAAAAPPAAVAPPSLASSTKVARSPSSMDASVDLSPVIHRGPEYPALSGDIQPASPPPSPDAGRPKAENPKTLANHAESKMVRGQHDEAYRILQRCLAQFPDNKTCNESLELLFMSGYRAPIVAIDAGVEGKFDGAKILESSRRAPAPPKTNAPSKAPSVAHHKIVIKNRDDNADIMELGISHKRQIDTCIQFHVQDIPGRPPKMQVAMLLNHEGYAVRTNVITESWRYTKTALCLQDRVERWQFPREPGPPRNATFTIDLMRPG